MSTSREKDQSDFDLEQMVKIIDSALESDDQRIKDALRGLMTITVLCTAEHPDQVMKNGPLARLFEDMRNLNQRLGRLEDELNQVKWNQQRTKTEPFMPTAPATNPWTGTNPNGPKPMWGPSYTSTTFKAGDDPSYKGASSSTKLAEDFLRELESK